MGGTALPLLINYDSPRELRAFLDERGLGMRKKFGQNFLVNPAVRSRLLDALELGPGDEVWEIGPGLGAMTAGLLERGGRVTAFEIDPAFAALLGEFFAAESPATQGAEPVFHLIEGDVFKTWPQAAGARRKNSLNERLLLLGNLPYNIGAALLGDFIEQGWFFTRIVVTVQREVARRMAARPGSADYSSFSVLCSSAYKITPFLTINGASFFPAPRVDSQGVRLDPLPRGEKLSVLFYPMVRSLFSNRRKTIRNTLSNFAASVIIKGNNTPGQAPESALTRVSGVEAAAEVLKRSGIPGDRRPETLDIDEFAALAAFLEETVGHG